MLLFEKPKFYKHGWHVLARENPTNYLHADGVVRHSTYNGEKGCYSGYFETEVLALHAIVDYYDKNVVDYCVITDIK